MSVYSCQIICIIKTRCLCPLIRSSLPYQMYNKYTKVCEKLETGGKGHWSIIGNVVSSVEVGAKYVRVTSTQQRNACMHIQTCRI